MTYIDKLFMRFKDDYDTLNLQEPDSDMYNSLGWDRVPEPEVQQQVG